jgi:hypothetical protein
MYRLALKLGRTVTELESTMTRSEFLEWIAFYKLHPFGDELKEVRFRAIRAEIRYGFETLAYVFGKVMSGKGSKPKPPSLDKFKSVDFHGMKKTNTIEDQKKQWEAFIAHMGAKKVIK